MSGKIIFNKLLAQEVVNLETFVHHCLIIYLLKSVLNCRLMLDLIISPGCIFYILVLVTLGLTVSPSSQSMRVMEHWSAQKLKTLIRLYRNLELYVEVQHTLNPHSHRLQIRHIAEEWGSEYWTLNRIFYGIPQYWVTWLHRCSCVSRAALRRQDYEG